MNDKQNESTASAANSGTGGCDGSGIIKTGSLKTLEQHNLERYQELATHGAMNKPLANGIACPKCGKELLDSDPLYVLTSNPPQKDVYCPSCGYRGYRVA